MPNVSSFGAQTDNAVVSGTVTDRQMIIPDVPPQGLMSVGPRVTPNFVKPREWNAQTTYHFFDAVRDTAGNAYVATKPVVPAGTPLTDEGYWFLWADPDTRFDDLNETVKTFNQRITQNTNDIATKAPINHASEETIYGIGNSLNYGHLRLAADDTPMTSDANAGVAATPKMISDYTYKKAFIKLASDFGLNPSNNGSENATALNNAIDYCINNHCILIVTAGEYTINSQIELPNGIHIEGESVYNTTLKFPNNKGFTNKLDANGNRATVGATLKNITIVGSYDYKSVPNESDIYTYYEVGGVFGTFYNCEISRLNIKNFPVGISTKQTPTSVADYNQKYNQKFGDNRTIEHINIAFCYIGAFLNQWDCYYNDFRINNVYYIGNMLGYMNMLHAWNYSNALYARSLIGTNFEFDYQYNNPDIPSTNFNSALVCFGASDTNNQCAFSNLKIYNLVASSNEQFFPTSNIQPMIRCVQESNIEIDNLYIGCTTEGNHGWNSLDDTVLPREIISCQPNSHATVKGQVHPKYTTINNMASSYNNIHADITSKISGYKLTNSYNTGKATYEFV